MLLVYEFCTWTDSLSCVTASNTEVCQRQQQQQQPQSHQSSAGDADKKTKINTDELNVTVQADQVAVVNDDDEEKIPDWIRCSPADLYFKRNSVITIDCDFIQTDCTLSC